MSADDAPGLAARRAALVALRTVEEQGAWSTVAVPDAVAHLGDERDRRFASHLAYDTIRWSGSLDWLLKGVLNRPLAKVEPDLLRVLRLGALQLWRSQVPARAAVTTSATLAGEAVPEARARGAAGFVNGVLRNLARRLNALPWPDVDDDPITHLALSTGHPAWIVQERVDVLGVDAARALLDADNDPPGLTLRAVGDRDALVAELADLGLDATPTTQADRGVRVPGADPRRLACVSEGRAVPQDEASMLVVDAAGVQPGDRVIDLCAAPGGKATDLAHRVGPTGHVTAVELHPHRADMVRAAASRLGLDIEVVVGDARAHTSNLPADVVLVDAPCTGLGTGRRRPEVRWRRTPDDVTALATLQDELLSHAVTLVRPGGTVVYAVCTWTTAETVAVVDRAIAVHGLERVSSRQLGPDTDGTDGMFVAVLRTPAASESGQ